MPVFGDLEASVTQELSINWKKYGAVSVCLDRDGGGQEKGWGQARGEGVRIRGRQRWYQQWVWGWWQ